MRGCREETVALDSIPGSGGGVSDDRAVHRLSVGEKRACLNRHYVALAPMWIGTENDQLRCVWCSPGPVVEQGVLPHPIDLNLGCGPVSTDETERSSQSVIHHRSPEIQAVSGSEVGPVARRQRQRIAELVDAARVQGLEHGRRRVRRQVVVARDHGRARVGRRRAAVGDDGGVDGVGPTVDRRDDARVGRAGIGVDDTRVRGGRGGRTATGDGAHHEPRRQKARESRELHGSLREGRLMGSDTMSSP